LEVSEFDWKRIGLHEHSVRMVAEVRPDCLVVVAVATGLFHTAIGAFDGQQLGTAGVSWPVFIKASAT
jgi:hypothetical protein